MITIAVFIAGWIDSSIITIAVLCAGAIDGSIVPIIVVCAGGDIIVAGRGVAVDGILTKASICASSVIVVFTSLRPVK